MASARRREDLRRALQDLRRHGDQERRRADRRDHLVHQHFQPRRAARRRPARQESRGARLDRQPAREDLARAGLARGHRVPDQGGSAARISRSSASRSRPTAAPPASAMPARSRSRSTRRSSRTTWCARRCCPATATSKPAHPSEHPRQLPRLAAAGGGVRAGRIDAGRPEDPAARQIEERRGRLSSATSGRAPTRCAR